MGGMRFRKLRIAWSVLWGLLAVLLIALWMRSYTWRDSCFIGSHLFVSSCYGQLSFYTDLPPGSFQYNHCYANDPAESTFFGISKLQFARRNLLMFRKEPTRWQYYFPHWSVAVPVVALAVAPWARQIKCRFSLRTLLIATTLVAVVLGVIVYMARK
jgi:hypothetical protein